MRYKNKACYGEEIRRIRKEKRWSQARLGQMLNVDQTQISDFERGVSIPHEETLFQLLEISRDDRLKAKLKSDQYLDMAFLESVETT